MGRRHDLQKSRLAERRQRLAVVIERGLERLLPFPVRVLRRQRLDPVDRKNDLEIHRLLGPQRAVVVEGGDALVGGTKSALPSVVTRGMKSVIDFFTAPSFQEGRGSAGACAWLPPNQQRPAISTIVFRTRWKDGRSVCIGSSHRGTLLPGVRENFRDASAGASISSGLRRLHGPIENVDFSDWRPPGTVCRP
jgi:hypothetical protein